MVRIRDLSLVFKPKSKATYIIGIMKPLLPLTKVEFSLAISINTTY